MSGGRVLGTPRTRLSAGGKHRPQSVLSWQLTRVLGVPRTRPPAGRGLFCNYCCAVEPAGIGFVSRSRGTTLLSRPSSAAYHLDHSGESPHTPLSPPEGSSWLPSAHAYGALFGVRRFPAAFFLLFLAFYGVRRFPTAFLRTVAPRRPAPSRPRPLPTLASVWRQLTPPCRWRTGIRVVQRRRLLRASSSTESPRLSCRAAIGFVRRSGRSLADASRRQPAKPDASARNRH